MTAEKLSSLYYINCKGEVCTEKTLKPTPEYIRIDGVDFPKRNIAFFLKRPERLPKETPKQQYTAEILSEWFYAQSGELLTKSYNEVITQSPIQPIKGKGYGTIAVSKAIKLLEKDAKSSDAATIKLLTKRVEWLERIIKKYDLGA
jgi:hypothetical protein